MGWIAYAAAWLAAAVFWSLASATSAGWSPMRTLPWGLLAMGVAVWPDVIMASWTPYDGCRFQVTLRTGARIMASRQRSRMPPTLGR